MCAAFKVSQLCLGGVLERGLCLTDVSAEECTEFTWQPTDQMMIGRDKSNLLLSFLFPPSILSDFPMNHNLRK